MKRRLVLLIFACVNLIHENAFAQGTAFTYQGQLRSEGTPCNGMYDFQFTLYDAQNTNGNLIGSPVTVPSVVVSNGLFTALIDFQSAAVFDGSQRWLAVGVMPHGGTNNFALLRPFQPITPAPYAITAGSIPSISNLVPAGAVYTNDPALGFNDCAISVMPNTSYYAVVTNPDNAMTDAEYANNAAYPGAIISTPDAKLYAIDGDGTLLGKPVQEQLFLATSNAGVFNGVVNGIVSSNSTLPPNVVFNNQPNVISWTSGQFVFKANTTGLANNMNDDGIVVENANPNKWSTIKFLDSNGDQVGAIGYGNRNAGTGADIGNYTNTYYVGVGFAEMDGFYFVQNEKIMGGWVRNGSDQSGDFVMFYHPNGTGFDSTTDKINDMLATNTSFRISAKTGNVTIGTNGHGTMTLGQAPTLQATNAKPSNVTVGTTQPDIWFTITNNGTAYFVPGWKNH